MKKFFSSPLGIIIIIVVIIIAVILIMQPQWLKDMFGPKVPGNMFYLRNVCTCADGKAHPSVSSGAKCDSLCSGLL